MEPGREGGQGVAVIRVRGWARDWRAWAFFGAVIAIGALDLALPPDVIVLSLLIIPVVGSATLGRPALTGVLTVVAILVGAISALVVREPLLDAVLRISALAGAGVLAVFLASAVAANRRRLAEARDRFRRFATLSADVFVLGTAEGGIVWVSDTVTGLLGWRPEQMTGRDMADLVHPDDLATLRTIQSQMGDGGDAHCQVRIATADGGWHWIEMNVGPAAAGQGQYQRIGTWRDIQPDRDADAALRDSEERYRLLAENASDVVFSSGKDRRLRWVSPNVTAALGWHPDELVGTELSRLVHPDDREGSEDRRRRGYGGDVVAQPPGGFVFRLQAKDGRYRWVSARFSTARDDAGEPDGIIGGLAVVDDLVAARQQVEADEARLRAVIDTMLDPYVLFAPVRDDSGAIIDFVWLDANDAACAYNHLTRDEALGRSLAEIMPAQVAAEVLAQNVTVLLTGEPLVQDDFTFPEDDRVFDIRTVRVGDAVGSTWRDVTLRHRAAEALRESEAAFRLLAENSTDVVLHLRDDRVVWVSPSLVPMLGWDPDSWRGHALQEFVHPGDLPAALAARDRVVGGGVVVTRFRMRGKDGTFHWTEFHAQPYLSDTGAVDGVAMSFRTVDREVQAERELERRARYDDLTGLLKRTEALERLHEIGQHVRRPGDETAGLFIDVDGFKSVNDTWGHAAGDAFLQALGERIRRIVRSGDTVARMGGDEFLVILEGLHSIDEATAIAEKIVVAARAPVPTREGEITATVSIGVTMSSPIETADDMVTRADAAMYEAKRTGRDRVVTVPLERAVG